MSWNEVVLEVDFEQTVSFSDALLEAGAMAVTVEDADSGTDLEKPIFGEPGADSDEFVWQHSRIIALISKDEDIATIVSEATQIAGIEKVPPFDIRDVPPKDWVRETQSQFSPIFIGHSIWVVPSWHEVPQNAKASDVILRLDPGLAFGTGSHPTTRLCLEFLEENLKKGDAVLDYGCGSGILGIGAFKLGATHVDGVDIDLQAVETAKENAKENQAEFCAYATTDYVSDQFYDIVVANILSGPLQQLAKTLTSRLKSGGHIILSGILDWQEQDVINAYAPYIALSPYRYLDGWVALKGQMA